MHFTDKTSFFASRQKVPVILQTEAAECGLACLGMIAGYYGDHANLAALRGRFPVSLKGATLGNLIHVSNAMEMGTRALRLETDQLSELKLPCILHWNFNHFVVLQKVSGTSITIHDPACGIQVLSRAETSAAFTGVALEVWPNPGFKPQPPRPPIRLSALMGKVSGLRRSFVQILVLAVALEVFSLVSPFFLQWVVDEVLVSADGVLLNTLAIGFLILIVMQQVTSLFRSWVILYMGTTLNVQWRSNVFTHLLRLPIQYFEKRHIGDIVSRFGAVDEIQHTLTTALLEALLDGLMTLLTLIMMFIYSTTLGGIACASILLYAMCRWFWYAPLRMATEEQIIHTAKQQTHFLETVRGVKAVKLFQRQEERRSAWLTLMVDQLNAELSTQKLQLLYKILNSTLFGAGSIVVIWLGARLVLAGDFSVGALLAFISYKTVFDTRVAALIDKLYDVKMLRLQGERLADIVMTEPEPHSEQRWTPGHFGSLKPEIEVSGLRFRYAEHEPLILDDVNFRIEAGESVAIVGQSGCGKTTLMNVMLGILPPTTGDVLVGGVSIRHLGFHELRKMIGTVLQDDVLFAGSIANNISFFDPQADQAWIEECASLASIAAEINAMPMGYNTLVGDMGTVLSGGQRQRILLARALYKRPSILFLDEATSNLDVAREYEVNKAVAALKITRVIIAHRPETIATAERVITLGARGRVQGPPTVAVASAENMLA